MRKAFENFINHLDERESDKVLEDIAKTIQSYNESHGCDYCNPDSDDCHVQLDEVSGNHYQVIETSHWDEYNDGFDVERIYINYCPMCGRRL